MFPIRAIQIQGFPVRDATKISSPNYFQKKLRKNSGDQLLLARTLSDESADKIAKEELKQQDSD